MMIRNDFAGAILVGLIPMFLTLPISIAFDVDRGWPQWVAGGLAVGMSLLALFTTFLVLIDGPWGEPYTLFMFGILVLSFVGNWLKGITVRN